MSTAVNILQGRFGRVALLDMDKPLVTPTDYRRKANVYQSVAADVQL